MSSPRRLSINWTFTDGKPATLIYGTKRSQIANKEGHKRSQIAGMGSHTKQIVFNRCDWLKRYTEQSKRFTFAEN
jgi:hypothetical protein